MAHVLVKHIVNDYAGWKKVFDNFSDFRKQSGEKSFQIFHPGDNPNNLTLLFEWDTEQNAETFLGSTELKTAMQNAGVTEEPNIQILNQLDKGAL